MEHTPNSEAAQPQLQEDVGLIDRINMMTPAQDGHIVAPLDVRAKGRRRIRQMMPQEWQFASRISAPIDDTSGRLVLDTNDFLPEQKTLQDPAIFENMIAVMRIFRTIGRRAVDGYVVDYRRVANPSFQDLGLSEGANDLTFIKWQTQYSSVLPLGVLFAGVDGAHYVGDDNMADDALYLGREVDKFVIGVFASSVKGII